jgi:hypothetical protein
VNIECSTGSGNVFRRLEHFVDGGWAITKKALRVVNANVFKNEFDGLESIG